MNTLCKLCVNLIGGQCLNETVGLLASVNDLLVQDIVFMFGVLLVLAVIDLIICT